MATFTLIFIAVSLTTVTKCYNFVQQLANWQEAQDYCLANYGAPLATITTEAEYQQALRDINGSRLDTFIGLNDRDTEGLWQWIDGTDCSYTITGLCTDDSHWSPNEPNDSGTEDCGVINPVGYGNKYNDLHCNSDCYFLCNPPNTKCVNTLLTDLNILSSTSGYSQSPYINTWLGESSIPMGDGNIYENFLVIHPPNHGTQSVEYELNEQYEVFRAVIGPEHSGVSPSGSCIWQNNWAFSYKFYVDNVLAYLSPTFNNWNQFVKIEIDVVNATVLKIETNSEGSNYCDHATIANPSLICPNSCTGSECNCQCGESDISVCIDDNVLNSNNAAIHHEKRNNDDHFQMDMDEQGNTKMVSHIWEIAALVFSLWIVILVAIIIIQRCKINKLRKLQYQIAPQDDDPENIIITETCKNLENE
eukprot:471727_1